MDFIDQFEPSHLDPKTEEILAIQAEMIERGSEILALYFDALAGFSKLRDDLESWRHDVATEMKERFGIEVDEGTFGKIADLKSPPPHNQYSQFDEFLRTLADYRLRLEPEGRNAGLIGNYLIIALYQFWEDSWRGRIKDAIGQADLKNIKSDFWGDLRLIRICLVHKRSVADQDVAQKCVLFRWFNEGDDIVIDREKIDAITLAFRKFVLSDIHDYK